MISKLVLRDWTPTVLRGRLRWLRRRGLQPKLWLALYVSRAMLVSPTALAAEGEPRVPAGETQQLSVDEVLIEGKLYSPQALFIVSRAKESFGRDSAIPHYMNFSYSTRPVPYRLRRDVLHALLDSDIEAHVVTDSTEDSIVENPEVPRRSP